MRFKPIYIKTNWGNKNEITDKAIASFKNEGYSGLEVNTASTGSKSTEIVKCLHDNNFIFAAQQWLPPANETVDQYINRLSANLETIAEMKPKFINSHTGKDYFSFDDNCRVIEVMERFTRDTGIKIYHETHRGRFAFHVKTTLAYLEQFPNLKLTADFSHWCNVSESMLQDQDEMIEQIIPHVCYIHARVGHEHSPQVNDPAAPEWKDHLERFFGWWDSIIQSNTQQGKTEIYICPEFGPTPYMPALPYSREPVADQGIINSWMLKQLISRYSS